jgi:hypothetical protein
MFELFFSVSSWVLLFLSDPIRLLSPRTYEEMEGTGGYMTRFWGVEEAKDEPEHIYH